MNNQIRKIFVIVLLMFALLGVGVTNTQFISASSLNADARNQRTILHAAETDRGPIIVDKTAIVSSEREQDSKRYARSYAEGPLYAPVTGYFSSVGNASTGIEAAEEDVLDGQSQTLLGQRLHNLLTGQNRQGGGVSLTLNSQMQKAAAEALGNRKGAVRQMLNMFLVWAATGIWHGANWNFIVWGLYYFVLLVIEKNFLLKFLKKCPLAAHIYTLFFVVLGWGIFTANQPGAPLGLLLNKLFVPQGGISPVYYLRNYGVFLVLGCVCSSVLPRWLWERISRNTAVKAVVSALLALLCIAYVVAATNTTALYANF